MASRWTWILRLSQLRQTEPALDKIPAKTTGVMPQLLESAAISFAIHPLSCLPFFFPVMALLGVTRHGLE